MPIAYLSFMCPWEGKCVLHVSVRSEVCPSCVHEKGSVSFMCPWEGKCVLHVSMRREVCPSCVHEKGSVSFRCPWEGKCVLRVSMRSEHCTYCSYSCTALCACSTSNLHFSKFFTVGCGVCADGWWLVKAASPGLSQTLDSGCWAGWGCTPVVLHDHGSRDRTSYHHHTHTHTHTHSGESLCHDSVEHTTPAPGCNI